jgi:hypothetical protein
MKLFLVASLIALTAALKDIPRRRKSTSQNTKRVLHGNGKGRGSKKGYLVATVETDDVLAKELEYEEELEYENYSFAGTGMDPKDGVDNTKDIIKLVQNGVASTNADDYTMNQFPGSSTGAVPSMPSVTSPSAAPSGVLSAASVDSPLSPILETLPREVSPGIFSSDVASLVPSMTPISLTKEVAPTAFSSDTPSLVPSSVPTEAILPQEARPTAFSIFFSDAPSLVPSMNPSSLTKEVSPTAFSSDTPSLVPSMVPSSATLPQEATPTTLPSDAPSLVPSRPPSSAALPEVVSPTPFPTEISGDGSPSVPSANTSDSSTSVTSVMPSGSPIVILTSASVDAVDPSEYATCEQYDSPAFDDSVTAEIAVEYWYQLEVENNVNVYNVPVSELVDTVEVVLLETVQATMCTERVDRRRLATNSIAFSASPSDLRMGT